MENLLGLYTRLCDDLDVAGLADLLTEAVVAFGDTPPVSGHSSIRTLYERAFAPGHASRHLISNPVISQPGPRQAVSRVYYTRWTLEGVPQLVGMGEYLSEFVAHGAHWQFATHTVRRDWVQE